MAYSQPVGHIWPFQILFGSLQNLTDHECGPHVRVSKQKHLIDKDHKIGYQIVM